MVSGFIGERNRYLKLREEENYEAKKHHPTIKSMHDSYWSMEKPRRDTGIQKLMDQMKNVVKIAEVKYPRAESWRIVWVFDHSSCHAIMAEDALDVSKISVSPGRK